MKEISKLVSETLGIKWHGYDPENANYLLWPWSCLHFFVWQFGCYGFKWSFIVILQHLLKIFPKCLLSIRLYEYIEVFILILKLHITINWIILRNLSEVLEFIWNNSKHFKSSILISDYSINKQKKQKECNFRARLCSINSIHNWNSIAQVLGVLI